MAMRLRPCRIFTPALLAMAAILVAPGVARADLEGDVTRLVQSFAGRGAKVERLEPIFLERGRAKTIDVDRAPRAGRAAPLPPDTGETGCLTIAVLSVRTTELFADAEESLSAGLIRRREGAQPAPLLPLPRSADTEDPRRKSAGGAAVIARCGADRGDIRRVTIELASARAAVEILVARSPGPLGEIRDVLPERAPGLLAPRGDTGGAIEPGPLAERLARAERRARAEGASRVTRTVARANPAGTGHFEVRLGDGCHRVELMADVPAVVPRRATDLDAEAHAEGGRVLARDRADVPDVRLDFCLGEPTAVEIPFVGASGPALVTLADALFPTPAHVPTRWGPRARSGLAAALLKRHAPAPVEDPIAESLGVQGVTAVPIAVEPGKCYLAAAALVRGEARVLRLSATIGDRAPHDDVVERPEGASVAFCAGAEGSAVLEVDARGNAPWWALEVWAMGAGAR